MTETRRQVMTTGLVVAFVTLASGLVGLLVASRVLWVLVFAAVCYPAFRATHRERPAFGAPRPESPAIDAPRGAGPRRPAPHRPGPRSQGAGRGSAERAPQPWRAEVVAGAVSVLGCLLLVPLVTGGLAPYLLAAVVVLVVYLLSAWWFG